MGNRTQRRNSRMREATDADDEYRETGSKEAAARRHRAICKGTTKDWEQMQERFKGRALDEARSMREHARRLGVSFQEEK